MKQIILAPMMVILLASLAFAQERQEYAYGSDPNQTLDIYQAAGTTNAPVIVMLHGGAWRTGDKRNRNVWRNKATYWTARGYVFASVNTRLIPDAYPIDQARDLAAAMGFIQQNAAQVGGDPNQVILMGHSAGAHVAGLLATRDDLRTAAGLQPWKGTVVLDSAAIDLVALMETDAPRLFERAFGSDPSYWTAASPINFVSRADGPFLIVCSAKRDTPCPAAQSFGQSASATGVPVTILPVELSHSQINAILGEQNSYTAAVDDWISATLR